MIIGVVQVWEALATLSKGLVWNTYMDSKILPPVGKIDYQTSKINYLTSKINYLASGAWFNELNSDISL